MTKRPKPITTKLPAIRFRFFEFVFIAINIIALAIGYASIIIQLIDLLYKG